MRKLVLGMSAVALMASAAAFAQEEDNTRLAAADSPAATFMKLDADADGRISAIEAANNSKIAAGFTTADARQGRLSLQDGVRADEQLGERSRHGHATLTQPERAGGADYAVGYVGERAVAAR